MKKLESENKNGIKIINLQEYKNKKKIDSFRNPDGKIRIMDLLLSDRQLKKELLPND
jgi:hypothetical protein